MEELNRADTEAELEEIRQELQAGGYLKADTAKRRIKTGKVPPMRFGGFWKDMGPQYMRGISEGFERPEDAVWVAYSVNKEDIWVARIPVPIAGEETEKEISGFEDFGLYSPKWSSAKILSDRLRLRDADPYDYSKAERELGYTTRPLEVTLRDQIQWLKENGKI